MHGVLLRDKKAALFVEYDGFWRHGEKEGMRKDVKKSKALLAYAPEGSFVVRISHTICNPLLQDNTLWITVDTWQQGDQQGLLKTLQSALLQMLTGLREAMEPSVLLQIQQQMKAERLALSEDALKFAMDAAALAGKSSSEEVSAYFVGEGFDPEDIRLIETGTGSRAHNIDHNLGAKVQCPLDS